MTSYLDDNHLAKQLAQPDEPVTRRAESVRQLVGLLGALPDAHPPPHLLRQTVQRVEAARAAALNADKSV